MPTPRIVVTLNMSAEQYEQIEAAARLAGLKPSQWIRQAALEASSARPA